MTKIEPSEVTIIIQVLLHCSFVCIRRVSLLANIFNISVFFAFGKKIKAYTWQLCLTRLSSRPRAINGDEHLYLEMHMKGIRFASILFVGLEHNSMSMSMTLGVDRDIRWILMGGARRHCHCNLNNKRGENIITVDSALFKFNVAKISNSIF